MRLTHHGLISVPGGASLAGIYWLRLYEVDGEVVAVLTEVPGNPGPSVVNGMEGSARHLSEQFGVDLARASLFDIWPRGWLGPGVSASAHRVTLAPDGLTWNTSSRAEIEIPRRRAPAGHPRARRPSGRRPCARRSEHH